MTDMVQHELVGTSTSTLSGLDLRWNLRPGHSRVVPYVTTGFGYGLSHDQAADPPKSVDAYFYCHFKPPKFILL